MAVMDNTVRAVGRHGLVTLDEAAAAARKLHEYTRAELAEELGIKPIAVGRFLSALAERNIHEPDEDERGLFYRCALEPLKSEVFLPPEPAPDPLEAPDEERPEAFHDLDGAGQEARTYGRVTAEEVRDWALMLERFTIYQLAREMEVSYGTARRYVERLCEQNIIVDSGWKGTHDATIYEVRGEVPESRMRRERRPPVEDEVLTKWKPSQPARGLPVPTGGVPNVTNSKDARLLVAEALAFGWTVEQRANHAVVIPPGAERPIPIPSTPKGPGMVRAFRDQLRRAGLPDLGAPNQTVEDAAPTPGRGRTVGETSRTFKRRQANSNVAGTRKPGRKGRHRKAA